MFHGSSARYGAPLFGFALLGLLEPIYGLKQAISLLWQRLLEIMRNMGHE